MAIEEALIAGGNNNYTVKELPGLNHLFQTAQTGSLEEIGSIEETMSPVYECHWRLDLAAGEESRWDQKIKQPDQQLKN